MFGSVFCNPISFAPLFNSAIIPLVQKLENYIDGDLVVPKKGEYIENIDPSTGSVYSLIPDSNAADVESGGSNSVTGTVQLSPTRNRQ